MLAGGAAAAAQLSWGLQMGARADLLVADTADPSLLGVPASHTLDAIVFASPSRPWRDVMVAGRFVVTDHTHAAQAPVAARFEGVMAELWSARSPVLSAAP